MLHQSQGCLMAWDFCNTNIFCQPVKLESNDLWLQIPCIFSPQKVWFGFCGGFFGGELVWTFFVCVLLGFFFNIQVIINQNTTIFFFKCFKICACDTNWSEHGKQGLSLIQIHKVNFVHRSHQNVSIYRDGQFLTFKKTRANTSVKWVFQTKLRK